MDNGILDNEEYAPEKPGKRGAWHYVKKAFKYLFYALMTAAWAAVIFVIVIRGDDAIVKTPVLSARARELYESAQGEFEFYRVYPAVFMSEEGAFQLKNCVYAASAGEYEVGLRVAWTQLRYCEQCGRLYTPDQLEQQKKYDEEDDPHSCTALKHTLVRAPETGRTIRYEVFDGSGKIYEPANAASRVKNINLGFFAIKYEYLRLAFGGLYLDLEQHIINRESSAAPHGTETELSSGDGVSDAGEAGTRVYLAIYDAETDDRLFVTCVYDNNTYIEELEYVLPDSDYMS